MFFKKRETQSQMEKQPIEPYIGCLHKESKERQMVAEENKPDSPCGKIYLSWYPKQSAEDGRVAYSLMSYECEISDNSMNYFHRFNRICTDIACALCKDLMTATLVVFRKHWSEYTPEMQEYVDQLPQSDKDTRYFLYPNMLLRIGRGADRDLLEAYYKGREIDICDSVSYSCFAMREGFFESCPDSLFQIEIGSGAGLVEKFLTQFAPIVRQRDMDIFHNEVEITIDRRFIPHERVVETVKQACAKEGMPLHISGE